MRERIVLLDTPQDDELVTHRALENWARWCRSRGRAGHCYSAEGRYEAPAGNLFHTPAARMTTDTMAGEAVNAALLEIPDDHRRALVYRYFNALPDRIICRRVGIKKARNYQRFMRDARLMLGAALQAAAEARTLRTYNSDKPSTDETSAHWRAGAFSPAM